MNSDSTSTLTIQQQIILDILLPDNDYPEAYENIDDMFEPFDESSQ